MPCANGTDSCAPGQSVFWFSQGCTPGCPECDGLGQRVPFWDHCNATRAEPFEATLAKQYWTANLNATEGSEHDVWRYQPWRSPGLALCGKQPMSRTRLAELQTARIELFPESQTLVSKPFTYSHTLERR